MMIDYSIFGKEVQAKLLLLDLLSQKRDWYPYEALSFDVNISKSTLRTYLVDFENNSETKIFIFEKGKGIKFVGKYKNYLDLYHSILEESPVFLFIKEIVNNPHVTMDSIEKKLNISESFAKKIVMKLKKYTEQHGFYFVTRKKCLKFVGSELAYRNYLSIFLWHAYKGTVWPFSLIKQETILRFLDKYFKVILDNSFLINMYSYFFAVNYTRFHQGYYLQENELPDTHFYIREIEGFSQIRVKFQLAKVEVAYLNLLFQSASMTYSIDNVTKNSIEFHREHKTAVYQMYELFFSIADFDLSLLTSKEKDVFQGSILATFIHSSLFNNFNTFSVVYNCSEPFKDSNFSLYKKMESIVLKMRSQSKSPMLNNVDFITKCFCECYSLIGKITDFDPVVVIWMDTEFPKAIEYLLIKKLTNYFNGVYNVKILNSLSCTESNESVDLIITTSYFSNLQDQTNIPVVYTHYQFSPVDFNNISAEIEKVIQKKSLRVVGQDFYEQKDRVIL